MTPLDKEVDVYCAWIDHADQINSKSKKQTLGFNGNKNDSDSDDEFAGQEKKQEKKISKEPDFDDSEEEIVKEQVVESTMVRKQSNPYSASEKIAELGLG